jgi:hypothetical protein
VPNAAVGLSQGAVDQKMGVGAASWDHSQRLDVFYVGANGNLAHSWSWNHGLTWDADDWGRPAGYNIYGQVGVASWGDQRLDVFILGKTVPLETPNGTGNTLWHRYWDHGFASAWQSLGAAPYRNSSVDMGVSATSWGPGRIDVFAAGAIVDLQHWYSTNGTTFYADVWPTGAGVYGAPDVASWGDQRLDVFYRTLWQGPDDPAPTRHFWWDHGAYGIDDWGTPCAGYENPWDSMLLGAFPQNPSAVGSPPGPYHVGIVRDCNPASGGGMSDFYIRFLSYYSWSAAPPHSPRAPAPPQWSYAHSMGDGAAVMTYPPE